ncbi:auxin efflux carrier superfamily [Sodiomyces alkalinus F11]|uniref:Auxin efflux carrier superfamily n=1 Tax=Sodiomyces alkalinus (strain CBS 110278 / VKM F-3762 / F11) TaxID=1314773 RepID=A0A3N2Q362_SODAK|nr:auxin efflux carrier superfamily [Sodiomyces alkalinus F11]ROT41055.1 auxin efflux carrier superfamily [Sodiomyces alkalinus F11]
MAFEGFFFRSPTSYEPPSLNLQQAMVHDSHPAFDHLVLLVFSAVLQVVCVSLPGYIIARLGHFDTDKQKFLANLNVMLFTPCLIFTKLASQLNANKLLELGIIPVIFIIQTLVSWIVSITVARLMGFSRRASNFVTAMGVFGNSNSLPISLVISLSQTIKGLHWDRIADDSDDKVAARGILYLLIFQQLGQLVRWSWGYHVLLAPKDKYPEYQDQQVEDGRYSPEQNQHRYREHGDDHETTPLLSSLGGDTAASSRNVSTSNLSHLDLDGRTPVMNRSHVSLLQADSDDDDLFTPRKARHQNGTTPAHHTDINDHDDLLSFPRIRTMSEPDIPNGVEGLPARAKAFLSHKAAACQRSTVNLLTRIRDSLPRPIRIVLDKVVGLGAMVYNFLWQFMNPPLWAMLISIVVASVPGLQSLFFSPGTFIRNSVTSAVISSGNVAVPLILVVLGANLARNTQKHETHCDAEEKQIGRRLLIASLVCRMLLPTLIMAPILALFAKYVPVSILDDPIFVIVCFLLTGAPSALQLAQICQINEVYEGVMSNILFQSYVIWILPSTLVLVMCALEVVEWAL